MNLAERQRVFQARIMARQLADASIGLAVYRHGYRQTLLAALRDNFPGLAAFLDNATFMGLAADYVECTPSGSWTLADYGADFAEWITRNRPDLVVAAELAAIDWAARQAFAAANVPLLTRAAMPDIAWDRVRLSLAPGVRLLRTQTEAPLLWPWLPEANPAARPEYQVRTVLVWRQGWEPRLRPVEGLEAWLLIGIVAGQCFADICDASGSSAEAIGALLSRWIDAELLAVPAADAGG